MTTDQKLDLLEAFAGFVTSLTSTTKDDQAVSALRAGRAAVRTLRQGQSGAMDPGEAATRLRNFDAFLASDDEAARQALADRFDDEADAP